MTDFIRTPDENFAALDDFPYPPHFHNWQDLRMHYLDVGPADGPVVLMLHGMPAWSYLYRNVIPPLVAAGFRCIAPDHLGFGKSDKPTDIHWYTIARHTEVLTSLITTLDLQRITLMCQDWGGPTGLAQAAMMPERFDRLVIMNTWLHHAEFVYSEGIRTWHRHWHEGGMFCRTTPNIAALFLRSSGYIDRETMVKAFVSGLAPDDLEGDGARMYAGFAAPFKGLHDAAYNGLRRFPLSIPLDEGHNGNAAAQTHHYEVLLKWKKPAHFIWGITDDVFTEQWGRTWCEQMGATSFDAIAGAGHFLQNTHGGEVAGHLLRHIY
ncbi:MAG: haloalkane dehalogenase [Gammaproteobacteria bacterium]|jgi:haloalkane dehalogenase